MTHTKADLVNEIEKIVQKKWAEDKQPVLLSYLGTTLFETGFDYKSILKGSTLSALIRVETDKFLKVIHPNQRAKTGVIPASESYEFPQDEDLEIIVSKDSNIFESRDALYKFIHELSKLDGPDIDSVIIPTRVLVKLMEGK